MSANQTPVNGDEELEAVIGDTWFNTPDLREKLLAWRDHTQDQGTDLADSGSEASTGVSNPLPPQGCTCGALWTVRHKHGKKDCPYLNPPKSNKESVISATPNNIAPSSGEGELLDLYVRLFEAGEELSKQYERYTGNKDWVEWLREVLPKTDLYELPNAYVAQQVEAAVEKEATKEVMYCDGRSETRLVHYRNDFDGSYCYTELEEGYNDLYTLHVAQVYDDDFEKWHGLTTGDEPTEAKEKK
jgi:hypothetical protein